MATTRSKIIKWSASTVSFLVVYAWTIWQFANSSCDQHVSFLQEQHARLKDEIATLKDAITEIRKSSKPRVSIIPYDSGTVGIEKFELATKDVLDVIPFTAGDSTTTIKPERAWFDTNSTINWGDSSTFVLNFYRTSDGRMVTVPGGEIWQGTSINLGIPIKIQSGSGEIGLIMDSVSSMRRIFRERLLDIHLDTLPESTLVSVIFRTDSSSGI